ncbi:MAG: hypothetical protein HYZ14_04960 [Bacteroidetes bacterium]|nr:hypothetical protein [Bacteroidota bacterium]
MKKFILSVITLFLVQSVSLADQLAYLSKADADRAAAFIENAKKVALFCGCCDNTEMEVIKVKGVEVKFTGYEQFYEVYVMYSYQGELKSTPVDLAYVWVKTKGVGLQTVGQALGLAHDPCKTPAW